MEVRAAGQLGPGTSLNSGREVDFVRALGGEGHGAGTGAPDEFAQEASRTRIAIREKGGGYGSARFANSASAE